MPSFEETAKREIGTRDLQAQLAHWQLSIDRIGELDDIASKQGWLDLESSAGTTLRSVMASAVNRLKHRATAISAEIRRDATTEARAALQALRRDYLRTEVTLDFFADAINTRTSGKIRALLAAADLIATKSMVAVLPPLEHAVPPVLTYLDKGLGASILKAGLRLWDQNSINPVAAIKIARHNLLRPTALLHETGHQVAHSLDWNEQLASALREELPSSIGEVWSSWASEIAADAFAFVHAGYAAVAALRNVVDGGHRAVFRYVPGDPHPLGALRVLLGTQMCRLYGRGPFDDLEVVWRKLYPFHSAPVAIRELLTESARELPRVSQITLERTYAAFGGKSLIELVDPQRVSPKALENLEQRGGAGLFSSPYMIHSESLRLLALTGYRFATEPANAKEIMGKHIDAMMILGKSRSAA